MANQVAESRVVQGGCDILEELRHGLDWLDDSRTRLGNVFNQKIAQIAERVVAGPFKVGEFADIFACRANPVPGFELAIFLQGLQISDRDGLPMPLKLRPACTAEAAQRKSNCDLRYGIAPLGGTTALKKERLTTKRGYVNAKRLTKLATPLKRRGRHVRTYLQSSRQSVPLVGQCLTVTGYLRLSKQAGAPRISTTSHDSSARSHAAFRSRKPLQPFVSPLK